MDHFTYKVFNLHFSKSCDTSNTQFATQQIHYVPLKWKLFIHRHLLALVIALSLSLLNNTCRLTVIVRKTFDTRNRSNPCQITTLILLLGHDGSLEDKHIGQKATIQSELNTKL